jgi:hypothetical protein
MLGTAEFEPMAKKKKSDVRRHSAVARIDPEVLERAKIAASLMRTTLADYITDIVRKAADRDIEREAKKLTKGSKDQ